MVREVLLWLWSVSIPDLFVYHQESKKKKKAIIVMTWIIAWLLNLLLLSLFFAV